VILFRVSSSSRPSHRAIVFSGMFSLMGRHFLLLAGNFVSIAYILTTDIIIFLHELIGVNGHVCTFLLVIICCLV